ncbi:MAG: tyrosine-type recombinase/integrase [Polyangiaceae bacterium]
MSTQLVRKYVDAAELGKRGACHLFRHTMATLMLEGGADIRCIQEMLGHAELSTTQIYTQVSIRRLKAVHALTHPGATLEPARKLQQEAAAELTPLAKTDAVEALISRLVAEDDDDAEDSAQGDCA